MKNKKTSPTKPVKHPSSNQNQTIQTKSKVFENPMKMKLGENDKATLSIKNHKMAIQLKTKSATISEEESKQYEDSKQSVEEIDPLFIRGFISNLRDIDEETKKKHQFNQSGVMFQVEDYSVIFAGRHQVELKNGYPVGLYAPSYFKSAKNPETNLIEILIQRKIKSELTDPMQYPYLVIDPDNSIYPTYICSWIECKRRISIEHYIEFNQPANQYMILGNAIHRYLQWLIRKEVEPIMPTLVEIQRLYDSFIYEMFLIDLDFEVFSQKIENGIVNMVEWYHRHVIKGERIELNAWDKKYLKIERAIGSEVMFKSSYFGIRGKVDGLLQGEYIDEKNHIKYSVVIPFELKTGKKVLDTHKKQIDLYTLLMREYKQKPVIGLLYYSETSRIQYRMENCLVSFENVNVHRNKIISNLLKLHENPMEIVFPALPQILDQCKFCNCSLQCGVPRIEQNLEQKMKQLKDLEDLTEQCPEKYHPQIKKKLSQLSILEVKYIQKWMKLLHLEQYTEKQENIRQKTKNGINCLKLDLKQLQALVNKKQNQPIRLKLNKKIANNEMSQNLDNYFRIGDKLRIFIPFIKIADGCRIMNTEKNTKKFFLDVEIKNQEMKFDRNKCNFLLQEELMPALQVDLEKYENSFYNFTRGYVYKFVMSGPQWMKDIVIEQKYHPKKILIQKQNNYQKYVKSLNEDQAEAFQKCVEMDKFCLVEGMPGTGKTQLILKLAQYFYSQGKTILITAFTNQALFNILEREITLQQKIPPEHIIRECSKYGIIEGYEKLSSQSQDFDSIGQYKKFFQSKKVWIVTISSLYIQHLPEKFDVVILDEASQSLEPNNLEAIVKAEKFVLIGDERQLQPVVKSKEAGEMKMQISLFERLCGLYPENKSTLKKQYRMHPTIMNLSNNLVYEGKLELALPEMKKRRLQIDQKWQQLSPAILHPLINPEQPLWFVNHDQALSLLGEKDENLSKARRYLQITITCLLYSQFRKLGVSRKDILIISAYNSLVHQIVKNLKHLNLIEKNEGDVLTIDKSQGTDKEVIIFLFCKGNKDLVQNYRRLNVALTRARNKFIIVGSKQELNQLAVWTGKLAELLTPFQFNTSKAFLQFLLTVP